MDRKEWSGGISHDFNLSLYGLSRRWISVIKDYQEVYHIMTELSASVQDMALLFKVINLSLGTWHVVSDN